MELGKIINSTATANSFGPMVPNILVNMFMIRNKALAYSNGQTADHMKATGKIVSNMGKGNLHKLQAKVEQGYGKTVRD